MKQQKNDM